MPVEALTRLFNFPKKKYALLDTNWVVLHISAKLGPNALTRFKRLRTDFGRRDAMLLLALLNQFNACRTTAYVLAEASNLANGLTGEFRFAWFRELAGFAVATEEEHVGTRVVGSQHEVVPFGVADAALSYLAQEHTLITSDGRLSSYLESIGRSVVNFNHLRLLWMHADV